MIIARRATKSCPVTAAFCPTSSKVTELKENNGCKTDMFGVAIGLKSFLALMVKSGSEPFPLKWREGFFAG